MGDAAVIVAATGRYSGAWHPVVDKETSSRTTEVRESGIGPDFGLDEVSGERRS